jgi:electron transport complex protein RnfE
MKTGYEFFKGLWDENPIFRLLLGMCPTLAVTNAAMNGLSMGLATTFVLLGSNIMVAALKNVIPDKVRIPSYIIIIATFVTIADLGLAAFFPDIYKVLGLFIPLIVVNCIILARAEAFASKNTIGTSLLDALGMGFGFTWALTLLGSIREIMGMGSIFGMQIFGEGFVSWIIFILPPGAFLTLGLLLGLFNAMLNKKKTQCG